MVLHHYCTSLSHSLPTFRYAYLSKAYETRKPGTFLELPTKLIQQIIRGLPCPDILNVTLTCHKIKIIAESVLYEVVTIRNPANIKKFARAISNNLKQASWVLSYTLEITREEQRRYLRRIGACENTRGDEDARVLRLLPNLQHLRIKSPWISKIELPRLFTQTLLNESSLDLHISSRLKTLYIEYYGPPLGAHRFRCSPASPFTNAFLHPGLEELTIVLMIEPHRFPNLKLHKSSTSLKRLRIINCDMTPAAVKSIIGIARALEELEISMTMPGGWIPRLGRQQLRDWVSCMEPARETLKKLVLEDNYEMHLRHDDYNFGSIPWATQPVSPLHFADFTSLKHLEIYYDYILGMRYNDSHLPQIFPPNLETLKFLRRGRRSYPPSCRIPLDIPSMLERTAAINRPILVEMSLPNLSWERFTGILDDPKYLQKLRRIVLTRQTRFPFSIELEATCKAHQIELLEDPIYLRAAFEDNFYEAGGEFPPECKDEYFQFG